MFFYISAYGFIAEKYVYLQVMKGRKFQQEKKKTSSSKRRKGNGIWQRKDRR
jgi:hypothetical protein